MKNKRVCATSLIVISIFTGILFNACAPLKEFGNTPTYQGTNNYSYQLPAFDKTKKTVVVVANNDGTELFDMLAPFYLFNATGQANVYIVAKNKLPIVVKKGIFILPQSTFGEMDSLGISPDVIVIPFLSAGDSSHQDPVIVNWIKKHYSENVNILAVCDGAATAAATGIFDAKPITAHASDLDGIKKHFSKPVWIRNTSVANEGNLYSTAGVSNAAEGSLLVIDKLFGHETMKMIIENIGYPLQGPKLQHHSNTFRFSDKAAIAKKIFFKKNRRIGVLLQDGLDEFQLAAIMDTYNRTFPKSIESFSAGNATVKTKYGLTLIPTGDVKKAKLDELHINQSLLFSPANQLSSYANKIIWHNDLQNQYIIDNCLQRIRADYGRKFENVVKLMLDYN